MKREYRRLLVAGILVFVAGLIILFPARVAVNWFAPDNVRIAGIKGTIWRGSADALEAPGLALTAMSWDTSALGLLTGKLSMNVSARPAGGFVDTKLTISPGGQISLKELSAAISLSMVAAAIRTPGLSGDATLRFDELILEDGIPIAADGTVEIASMRIAAVSAETLGGYRLVFVDASDGIAASIEDTDGIIDIAGSLQFASDRSYRLLAQISPKPSVPENLKRRIATLPSGNAPGSHEIRLEGAL